MAKILYANTIGYDFDLQQRPHHIFNELAKRGHEIYWIDPRSVNTKIQQFKKRINDNLTIYYDWEKFCQIYKGKIDIYFSSWSKRWIDIEKIQPKKVIYDSLDLFPQNEDQERKMVEHADIILTTANNLYNYHKQHTNKPIYMCENGCFYNHRNKQYGIPEVVSELRKNNEPCILFSGALALDKNTGWVDINFLREITKKYYIIVVGKVWGVNQEYVNKYKDVFMKMINIGVVDYETLQSYYAYCDVNILPFKRCQVADYSFPLKTIEGCNHGKICVSSDIPVSVELNNYNPNAILLSKNPKEFVKNIDIALRNKDNQNIINECYNIANKHTWTQKVDIIEKTIREDLQL